MRISGNPSEAALLRFVERITSAQRLREEYEIVFEIPFNSIRKWHLVIVRKTDCKDVNSNGEIVYTLMMKGAPEVLIKKCNCYASEEGQLPMSEEYNYDFQDAYLHFGKEGTASELSIVV